MVLIEQVCFLQRFSFEEASADFRLSGKPQPLGRLEFDKESEQERKEITEVFSMLTPLLLFQKV
ncbi:hypothetical protein DCC62_07440 [candidate division KSB1 bacterium]|nr:MAG: hypothetical protein DCC62_07440 [candidate division KSB1 bacterium]